VATTTPSATPNAVAAGKTPTAPTTPAPRAARELSAGSGVASVAPAAASADPKAMGTIRVRTLDKGSNQYFATKYSLHLPDGRWMYGTLRTGSGGEGWGTAIPRTAGRYELEITDFVCGDKIWFLREPLRKTIDVQPGQPADVTVEMDLANLPARKSLDNPTGAKCTAWPGAAR
jgi:hypothetical protein